MVWNENQTYRVPSVLLNIIADKKTSKTKRRITKRRKKTRRITKRRKKTRRITKRRITKRRITKRRKGLSFLFVK